jgi:hypothetical protein
MSGVNGNCSIILFYMSLVPVWWQGNKNSPTVTHACRKRRLKWVATLPLGNINTEVWSSGMGVGRGANNPTLKEENCWEASKKFSRILWRRPRPKLGCGAKEGRRRSPCVETCLSWLVFVFYLHLSYIKQCHILLEISSLVLASHLLFP